MMLTGPVRRVVRGIACAAGAALLVLLLASPSAAGAAQPPSAADQEYVPVDPSAEQEQLPAAPLVIGAYSVVWVAAVLYLWSIWRRLSSVERELAQVARRVDAGPGR